MKIINKIIKKLNIDENCIEYRGNSVCKILLDQNNDVINNDNKNLILVTATNPTTSGEGKTTMSIGINDAFNILKHKSILCLREPSLGPVFGVKGGAVGGGKSCLIDGDNINLHFTGDFHAITSANNLLLSIIDNHIFQGNILGIDIENIFIKRCLDVNDRSLRGNFVITAASDIMAILCMSYNIKDLRKRLNNLVIGLNFGGDFVKVKDLRCVDALIILLKDAINPNLTYSNEFSPVMVHLGPFANIALGCNSIAATSTALKYSNYVITESGFGSDLGAEKFINIKQRIFNLPLKHIVIVTTIKSLKYNSTLDIKDNNLKDLQSGIVNLKKHIDNMKSFGIDVIVALNVFDKDKQKEIDFLLNYFDQDYCKIIPCYPFKLGGVGCLQLVKEIIKNCNQNNKLLKKIKYTYNFKDNIKTKILKVVTNIYGGKNVIYSEKAQKVIQILENKYNNLPICIAKTQYSFSDDQTKLGMPQGFDFFVNDIKLNTGAGFIIVIAGKIMQMPGLGKNSRYLKMSIDDNGIIKTL